MDPIYMHEKLAAAVDALMLPHGRGEAASIADAFHEIDLGMMGADIDAIEDDNIRYYFQKVKGFMNTDGLADPDGKGLYTVKAETMSDDDKIEFSRAVRELEALFDNWKEDQLRS